MNAEVKEKWLNALRSGEYKQTRGNLKTDCGFCCLGVLCDLYSKEFNVSWEKHLPVSLIEHNDTSPYSIGGEATGLPVEVLIWAGLSNARKYLASFLIMQSMGPTENNLDVVDYKVKYQELVDLLEPHKIDDSMSPATTLKMLLKYNK